MKPFIALVDDEPEILSVYSEVLSEHYSVSTFESPQRLLTELERGFLPEAVVSDLKMPGMSGIELARTARQKSYLIPFILISGYASKSDVAEAINENLFFGFIDKPFPMQSLVSLVGKAVQLSHDRAHARRRFEDLKTYLQVFTKLERSQFARAVLAENLILQRAPELFEDSTFRRTYLGLLKDQGETQRQISRLEASSSLSLDSSESQTERRKASGE